ncbi:HAD family hydrolase [Dielma fastidiosa]|uniref:HAD family hydrolase n=1 Tax=Dielma fastidiosa TaxID=1034346 RepID=A0AB35UMI0_9FIRM|nr:HAD-IIIA family hydrolase [Dielma fastidiosa]MDY5167067.1 HAD family hydrolase [Dielma fastidiosa]
MKKPVMIAFDYGQTIIDEHPVDFVRGTAEVMKYAAVNKFNKTPEEIQSISAQLKKELGNFKPGHDFGDYGEISNLAFQAFLYESQGIELSISYEEAELIFWDSAAWGKAAPGIEELLAYLHDNGIRTAVLSNNAYGQKALSSRINRILPNHHFEFILSTKDYLFRKPNRHIYELLLMKADLQAADVWYAGDSLINDVDGSRNAGLMPIWYTGASEKWEQTDRECLHIKHWHDLIDYLKELQ